MLTPSVIKFWPQVSGEVLRGLLISILLLIMLVIVGTTGYGLILDTNFLESLYMTVITISTVGFHEGPGLASSVTGKVFTMFLIFGGLAIGGYAVGTIAG